MNEDAPRLKKRASTPVKSLAAKPAAHSPVMFGGMARTLGVRIVSLTRKKVIAELPVKPMHINRNGRVNGGALMAFADVLGAAGTIANLPEGCSTTTLESKTNFFTAGAGPVLSAVSIPLHIGRLTNVWQTTISNPDGRRVAIVTQTQMVLPPRAETPAKVGRARRK